MNLRRRIVRAVERASRSARRGRLALSPSAAIKLMQRVRATCSETSRQGREHRVVGQLIVVDEIFVPERGPEHPLRHHGRDRVLDVAPRHDGR